jgi:hypothetical protein
MEEREGRYFEMYDKFKSDLITEEGKIGLICLISALHSCSCEAVNIYIKKYGKYPEIYTDMIDNSAELKEIDRAIKINKIVNAR